MRPLLLSSDYVVVEKALVMDFKLGDLVAWRDKDGYVTHRVISIAAPGLVTKGDNLYKADPPVQMSDIAGRVVAIERRGVNIDLQGGKWTSVNERLARLSKMQASSFAQAQRMGFRLFGDNLPPWITSLGRMFGSPFRVVMRLMVRINLDNE